MKELGRRKADGGREICMLKHHARAQIRAAPFLFQTEGAPLWLGKSWEHGTGGGRGDARSKAIEIVWAMANGCAGAAKQL